MDPILDAFYDWLITGDFDAPYSPHTAASYARVAGEFDAFCAAQDIRAPSEFSVAHVRRFIVTAPAGKTYAPATVGVRVAVLALIFDWLMDRGEAEENPVAAYRAAQSRKRGGKGGRAEVRLPGVLTWSEQERLLDVSLRDKTLSGVRNSAMIAVFMDSGLRNQELCDLPAAAGEDYLSGRLRVIGKGNKERLIRFVPRYETVVRGWMRSRLARAARSSVVDRLFISERGHPMSQPLIYQSVSKLLALANVQETSQRGAHLLRHTAASVMLATGSDLKRVQENLGHPSITTTERYLHLLETA